VTASTSRPAGLPSPVRAGSARADSARSGRVSGHQAPRGRRQGVSHPRAGI